MSSKAPSFLVDESRFYQMYCSCMLHVLDCEDACRCEVESQSSPSEPGKSQSHVYW